MFIPLLQWNPALQPPLQYDHLIITTTFLAQTPSPVISVHLVLQPR